MTFACSLTRYFFLVIITLTFLGCKTEETVSLREAKTITTEFVGKTFKVPPRSSEDLIELAARYDRPAAVAGDIANLQREAQAEASETVKADPARYIALLKDRMMKRYEVGDIRGSVEDARLAYRIYMRSDPDIYAGELLRRIAWREFTGGDFSEALRIAEMGLARANFKSQHTNLAQLLRMAVWRGEVEEAKRYLQNIEILRFDKKFHRRVYEGREAVARAEGRWVDAEQAARNLESHLRDVYSGYWVPRKVTDVTVLIANSLIEQGRLQEAELLLRERLLHELKRFGSSRETIIAGLYERLGQVYLRAGRFEDALTLARQSCAISNRLKLGWDASPFRASGGLTGCVNLKAKSLLVLRRFKATRAAFDEIKAGFGRVNLEGFNSFIRDDPNRLLTLILTGPKADTGTIVDELLARLTKRLGPQHYQSAEAKALKAALLARSGKPAAALPLFRKAFSVMSRNSQRPGGADAGLVRQRFTYFSEIYLNAIAEVLAGKQTPALVEEAFLVAAEARAHRVSAAVSASVSRSRIADPELAELARREQDAQRQVRALRGLLANATLRGGSDATREQLSTRVNGLRAARAAIVKELEQRFPAYAEIINPKPPSRSSIQHALRGGEALVSFYFTEKRGFTFVVPKSGPITLVDSGVSRREIAKRIAPLRAALDPDAATVGDIPAFDVEAAWTLYRDILHPARSALDGASLLVVVNHAAMGQLPLAVLTTEPAKLARSDLLFAEYRGAPWLVRRWSSAVVASEAAFVAGRSVRPPPLQRHELVAFGDPVFRKGQTAKVEVASAAPVQSRGLRLRRRSIPRTLRLRSANLSDLSPLPDTREEVEAIAVALKANLGEDVFLGAEASEKRVKTTDLSNRRVVVFATHGLVPGDLDGLSQPALALATPESGSEDGLLTLSEIMGLRLNADLVVLSACNTAAGDGAGAEAISGLARGFLYAGARALLVSGWPVETTSARLLTTKLFEGQNKENTAWPEALRHASLELADDGIYRLQNGKAAFSYAHPLFWAPFFIVGSSG